MHFSAELVFNLNLNYSSSTLYQVIQHNPETRNTIMSHEITLRANGKSEMAFTGEKAWHGLGQELQQGASIEQWQEAAGMDWRIQRSKVRYHTSENANDFQVMDSHHVLFRSDTKKPLGVVSPDYKIVQPRAVLEFFRELIEGNGYKLDTAGTLFGGRKFWALAKVASAPVVGQDVLGAYLLLATSCDGSMATEARETTVRVVCNNTLSMARYGTADAKVSHRTRFDAADMKAKLGLTQDHFETFMDDARQLAHKQVTNAQAQAFVRELLRPTEKAMVPVDAATGAADFATLLARPARISDNTTEAQRAPKGEQDILSLFRGSMLGQGLPGASGTAWGLVNAVTAFVDHSKQAKSVDHRLDSAFFGAGNDLKDRAFDLAFSL